MLSAPASCRATFGPERRSLSEMDSEESQKPSASDADRIARWVVGTYRLAAEAEVILLADDRGPNTWIILPPNTTVRVEAWTGRRSPSGLDDVDTYRAHVLDGPLVGRYVTIYDEGTPQSGESQPPILVGLPPAFIRLPDAASDLRRARWRARRDASRPS